jgi:hypothetical protein
VRSLPPQLTRQVQGKDQQDGGSPDSRCIAALAKGPERVADSIHDFDDHPKDSHNRPAYSSTECADCARMSVPKEAATRVIGGRSSKLHQTARGVERGHERRSRTRQNIEVEIEIVQLLDDHRRCRVFRAQIDETSPARGSF